MRLKTITIPAQEGATFVESSEIVLVNVIAMHRTGTQGFPVDEDPAPGSLDMRYEPNKGRVHIDADNPFGSEESVFVIYSGEPGVVPSPPVEPPPPTVCENPGSVSVTVNPEKSVTVTMPAAGVFTVFIGLNSDPCGGAFLFSGSTGGNDSWTSPGLPSGTYKACVRRFCGNSMFSDYVASAPFVIAPTLPPAPDNFGAAKRPADGIIRITGITGIPLVISSGAFPLDTVNEMISARHETFAGTIRVQVQVKANTKVVVALYKNGPLIQYKALFLPYTGATEAVFTGVYALPSDNLFIALDYN